MRWIEKYKELKDKEKEKDKRHEENMTRLKTELKYKQDD